VFSDLYGLSRISRLHPVWHGFDSVQEGVLLIIFHHRLGTILHGSYLLIKRPSSGETCFNRSFLIIASSLRLYDRGNNNIIVTSYIKNIFFIKNVYQGAPIIFIVYEKWTILPIRYIIYNF